MKYILLDIDENNDFEALKIASGCDFSTNNVEFVQYWDDYVLDEEKLDDPTFQEFKQFLDDNGYLQNLTIIDIPETGPGSLVEYWESLEE